MRTGLIRLAGLGVAMGAGAIASAAALAETPARFWQEVSRVNVACLVESERGVDAGPLHRRICARVVALASRGASVPVAAASTGDPATLQPGTMTLLVHGWTRPHGDGRLLALSIRPWRNAGGDDPGLLFAAAPRAVLLSGEDDPAVDAAVGDAMTGLLPWAAAPSVARSVHDNRKRGVEE